MKKILFRGATVYTPFEIIPEGVVLTEGGKIVYVGTERGLAAGKEGAVAAGAEVVDLAGKILAPGFIDIHVHGGGGYEVMGNGPADVLAVGRNEAHSGVTSFVPTLYAGNWERMLQSIAFIKAAWREQQEESRPPAEAEILGIFLEAPYMNPLARGGQNLEFIRKPVRKEYMELLDACGELLRLVLVAPEVEGGMELAREVVARGAVAGIGHSEATYAQVVAALAAGVDHVIHTFNGGNKGLTKREPGLIGAALNLPELTCELICDGVHVHPANMQLLLKAKGVERLILITDAIMAAGLPNGEYPLPDGRILVVKDGVATAKDLTDGSLYGSVLGLNVGVRNMVHLVGTTLQDALKMATINPARRIGVAHRKGSLAPGKEADLVVLKPDLEVERVYVRGWEIRTENEVGGKKRNGDTNLRDET